jgi:hypothetical protein
LIGLIKKKIEEKPKRWHEVLMEALWAYRVSKHGAIKTSPFELVYGQEAEEYKNSMMDGIDNLLESC